MHLLQSGPIGAFRKKITTGTEWLRPALLAAGRTLLSINHDLRKFFGALNLHRKIDKLQS
jgi:hypothetical protein